MFWSVAKFRLRYALAKLEKLTFCSAYFYFNTAILKFDSFSLLPCCTNKNPKGDSLFLSFCTIRISMYQKSILPYRLFPKLFIPFLVPAILDPRSGEFLHSIPFRSFLAGFLFDVLAIPRVRSGNGIPFSFRSFPFLPSSRQGEYWRVFRRESVICPCGITSHSFLSYVGFNTILTHSF